MNAEPFRTSSAGDVLALARLAALPPMEYDRVRVAEAAAMHVRVETLDTQVRAAQVSARDTASPLAPAFSDEALALRFTSAHRDRLRYVAAWGKWFVRETAVWREDTTMEVFNLARAICRTAATEANDPRVADSIASAQTVYAVERLARADRAHAASVADWDADPWLLNTPAGVIDLRTCQMRPHSPGDMMTKITAVAPEGDCPQWRAFLDTVTAGDTDLQLFLQRMAGYALTGSTREHALFFAYGTGGNGKGVMLNSLSAILGSYAAVASMETFTASIGDRHPADLAMLRGARMVAAQETEEGRRWAEARIKAMTGGDPITARFMRMDYFTYTPQFKLIIAGNHKPGLRSVDEAIRRRLHLLPFTVKIDAAIRDPRLPDKLRNEWPGILLWAVDGCALWQEKGLSPPGKVIEATDEYLEDEDALAGWLTECCTIDKTLEQGSSSLFNSWRTWAESAGEYVGSQKRFSQSLQSRGFILIRDKKTGKAAVKGLGFKPTAPRSQTVEDVS